MVTDPLIALRTAVIIVVGACTLAANYVVIALIVHQQKKNKLLIAQRRKRTLPLQSALCLGAGASITLRCCAELLFIFYGSTSDVVCTAMLKVHIFLYAMPITFIYLFLWNRQRFLYRKCLMQRLNNKLSKSLSKLVLSVMVLSIALTVGLFMTTRHYKKNGETCQVWTEVPDEMPWIVLVGSSVMSQVVLLGLYIYPLLQSRKDRRMLTRNVHGGWRDPLLLVKRALIAALICVLSDLAAGAVTCFAPFDANRVLLSNVVYDLNLIINLICMLCTFGTWRQRLFPFGKQNHRPLPPVSPRTPFYIETTRNRFF